MGIKFVLLSTLILTLGLAGVSHPSTILAAKGVGQSHVCLSPRTSSIQQHEIAEALPDARIPAGITDKGHGGRHPRFLADVNNDGIKDYCRTVGDAPNLFLSCQLGRRVGFNPNSYEFNSEAGKTDFGHPGSAWMEDVNRDGRMDFCRQVGTDPNRFYAALLAGHSGFSKEQYTRIQKVDGLGWVVSDAARQNAPNVAPRQNAPNVNPPTGKIGDIWVEHNVMLNGHKGMVIHANVNVMNALNKPCRLTSAFQYDDGRPLRGNDATYQSAEGNAMVVRDFTPTYANANYNDLQLFMPYVALNMGSGKAALRLRLSLYDVNAREHFAYSGFINFDFTK